MKCTSTLFRLAALILSTYVGSQATAQTTYVDNGTSNTYNLNSGDSLYIKANTFTGTINSFNAGARITVAAGATFQPANLNNPQGSMIVIGTAKIGNLNTNSNFKLANYGVFTVTDNAALNGNSQSWTNYYGATLKFAHGVTINNSNAMVNKGTLTSGGDITLNSGSSLTNNNILTIQGTLTANNATFNNGGKLEATNGVTFNGTTTFTNTCRMAISGNFVNNSNNIINSGLIWIPASSGGTITNGGVITMGPEGKIKVVNITNNGTIKGAGYIYITGTSTNYGTVGVTGTTTDTIKVYDASRTNPNTIFDTQYGNVRPNTIFASFAAPDTSGTLPSCSAEALISNTVLPVKWNYFTVSLSNNTPVLNWSAEQDPGTIFELQRSYDGANFTSFASLPVQTTTFKYDYADAAVNSQATVVYYRIRAIEPTGAIRISDTRTVKFSNQAGITVQTAPNPFTSQFNINYQSTVSSKITIRVIGINGTVQFSKTATVSNGYNSIAVTEAASLTNGIYLVQLMDETHIIASQRVVKQ